MWNIWQHAACLITCWILQLQKSKTKWSKWLANTVSDILTSSQPSNCEAKVLIQNPILPIFLLTVISQTQLNWFFFLRLLLKSSFLNRLHVLLRSPEDIFQPSKTLKSGKYGFTWEGGRIWQLFNYNRIITNEIPIFLY